MNFKESNAPKKSLSFGEKILLVVVGYLAANVAAFLIAAFVYSLGATSRPPLARVLPTIAAAHWLIVD